VTESDIKIEAKPNDPKIVSGPVIKEGQRKIKINGKLTEVFVTKVIKENGKTILKIIDDRGQKKKVRVK